MSEYKTRILLGALIAMIAAAGLAYAAIAVSQTPTTLSSTFSSTAQGQSTISGSGPSSMIQSSKSQQQSGSSGFGVLSMYLTDAPPQFPQFSYLLVNVSSLTLRYQNNVTCTSSPPSEYTYNIPSGMGTNVNLTNLVGKSVFLGATDVPSGNVTEVIFNITGAEAFFSDHTSSQLKVVANGKLMMPIHFQINPGGSSDLTIDITPNSIHISNGHAQVLTPVVHLTVVQNEKDNPSSTTTVVTIDTATTTSAQTNTGTSTTSTISCSSNVVTHNAETMTTSSTTSTTTDTSSSTTSTSSSSSSTTTTK